MLTNRSEEKLEALRSKLALNSQSLIELFRERASIAKEIGHIKKQLGLPPRIREREEAVMRNIPNLDSFSRSIISSLFEFSIVNESVDPARSDTSGFNNRITKNVDISGPRKDLEFFAGLLVSGPGVEVYADRDLPETIEKGLRLNGSHIIHSSHPAPDITICLGRDGSDCDILVTEPDRMQIRGDLRRSSPGTIIKVRT